MSRLLTRLLKDNTMPIEDNPTDPLVDAVLAWEMRADCDPDKMAMARALFEQATAAVGFSTHDQRHHLIELIHRIARIVVEKQLKGMNGRIQDVSDDVFADTSRIDRSLDRLRSDFDAYLNDTLPLLYLAAESDSALDAPFVRYFPLTVYLGRADHADVANVMDSVRILAIDYNLVTQQLESRRSSFFGRWSAKSKRAMNSDEFKDMKEKLKRAAELKALYGPQAEIDRSKADGIAALIDSLANTDVAAIQVGSLLIAKLPNDSGQSQVFVREMTVKEMIELAENPKLLTSPAEIHARLFGPDETPMSSLPPLSDQSK